MNRHNEWCLCTSIQLPCYTTSQANFIKWTHAYTSNQHSHTYARISKPTYTDDQFGQCQQRKFKTTTGTKRKKIRKKNNLSICSFLRSFFFCFAVLNPLFMRTKNTKRGYDVPNERISLATTCCLRVRHSPYA